MTTCACGETTIYVKKTQECKACYNHRYYEEHRERPASVKRTPVQREEAARQYYTQNRDRIIANTADWKKRNPDKVRAQHARYRQAHPDRTTSCATTTDHRLPATNSGW